MEEKNVVLAQDNPQKWFIRFLKGVAVGIGAILPGLSGGVLAVIFNIYDPLLKFLGNMKQHFKKNVLYFIPVGIGGVLGVVLFSLFVEQAFGKYSAQFTCLFIGFVAVNSPSTISLFSVDPIGSQVIKYNLSPPSCALSSYVAGTILEFITL